MTNNPSPDIKAVIVIIDDDHCIIDLTTRILSQRGFQVYSATSALEGMDIIARKNPELVLLDYIMPEMDGLTALREIKRRFPNTYVVMCTGMGNQEIAVELMKAGASEYLLKPYNNRNLVERLDNTLHIREIELHNKALQLEHDRLLKQIDMWNQELQIRIREKTEALQKAQHEIAQSEKVAALGYLSAGIAHEIRNPLNSISLFSQLMRQNASNPEQLDYLNKIIKEIDKADAIIHKLLGASRLTRTTTRNVLINQVIDTALEAFAPQIETGKITVKRHFHIVPPPIKADPAEIEQIFTNLFLNALDEMPGGGRLEIEVCVENSMVVVRVEDSGKGISDQILPNIFEPFFTTKTRGSGMGLPVIKRIARIYGGNIAVEKTTPQGTVFRLEFPPCIDAA